MKSQVCILFTMMIISISAQNNENAKAIITGNNKMISKLYPEISTPQKNLIFSPISLNTILSLVYQGSSGTTEEEFKNVLNIPDKLKTAEGYNAIMTELTNLPNITLKFANHVYVKNGYSIKPTFQTIAKAKFAAEADNIEFTKPDAAQIINKWVEDKTNNRIKDLIEQDQFTNDTRMVLVNSLYFNGHWATLFSKAMTRKDNFYVSEKETVPCDMMFMKQYFNYKDDHDLDAQVIQLPYENREMSMIIVLPHSMTGMADLEKKLASVDLEKITQNLREEEIDLSLPKFTIESTIELNEPLNKIGLAKAFSNKADFSELLANPEPLRISVVVQKAFIEVNEGGTEAAAATGVLQEVFAMFIPGPPTVFKANHSFLAFLKYKNIVLFVAKIERFEIN